MEQFRLDTDISVLYVTASSFPEGVMAAHQQLHTRVPFDTARRYFGLSRPEGGDAIVYKAAAEELQPGEAEKYRCECMLIPAGNYNSITIHNYMLNIPAIGNAFRELLAIPGHDPEGYCVELYVTDKIVRCMVRMEQ